MFYGHSEPLMGKVIQLLEQFDLMPLIFTLMIQYSLNSPLDKGPYCWLSVIIKNSKTC